MSEQQVLNGEQQDLWATVEVMGHGFTAGRVTLDSEWGFIRVDVPDEKGGYTTELYGRDSIFRIKFVSEEAARAQAPREYEISSWDSPIVTREQHEHAIRRLQDKNDDLQGQVYELQRRLTAIQALPESVEQG